MKYFFIALALTITSIQTEAKGRDPREQVSYSIPTDDQPELQQFAHHDFEIKWKRQTPGERSFEYDLPNELDGIGQDIELHETSPNHFEGPLATADCKSTLPLECMIKYRDLIIDAASADAIIQNQYRSPVEQDGRLQVSMLFRDSPEPGGILVSKAKK